MPKMQRAHFQLIADVFKDHAKRYGGRTAAIADEIARDMADALAATNPNFDRARFLAACEPGE